MKKFRDILGDMASWMTLNGSKVTNFSVGSVARSILEAVAMEIEDIYFFISSKYDEFQDNALYTTFKFDRKKAEAAVGIVTINFTQPLNQAVVIPQGFRVFTPPVEGRTVYFEVMENTLASMGFASIDVRVKCIEVGVVGNVPAFSVTKVVNPTPFMSTVYNRDRFFTGMPEETKEQRQKRFNAYVASLGRSSQPAIEYGCMQVPGIAGVYTKEDIGLIYVYAHDHFGELTPDMKAKVEEQLYEYKAGGIKAIVSGVVKKEVSLDIRLLINDDYDKPTILYKVEEEVGVYLNRHTVSKSLIRADLIRYIMNINSEAIQNVNINLNGDVVIEPQELIRPGTIAVSEMG